MPVETKPEIRYEDSAEMRTGIIGWWCKSCNRYWGSDEHMARYCCATSLPCECGGRTEARYSTLCRACRRVKVAARWEAMEKVEWDGKTPVCKWDSDGYFFDEDELADHIADVIHEGGSVECLRLAHCERSVPRTFEMAEFLQDYLGLDFDDHQMFLAIDEEVNSWIKKNAPVMWEPGGKAISAESLRPLVRPES